MERKSSVAAMLSMLLVSAPTTAKKITTTNLRDDTMKTNAVEVEGATQSDDLAVNQTAKAQNPAEIMVLDTDSLKFDFNSATIKDENVGTLKKLKDYIEKKNYKVAIYGHTDSKGTESYNSELSLRRAENVEEKLVELGLAPERIVKTIGEGSKKPVASNDTEEGRAMNRRIELEFFAQK